MIEQGIKTEFLQDFSGGLNTRLAPNRLLPTETPSATNVWYDISALSKRNGSTIASTTARVAGSVFVSWRGVYAHQYSDYGGGSSPQNEALYIPANIGQLSRNVGVYTTDGTTFNISSVNGLQSSLNGVVTTSGSPTITNAGVGTVNFSTTYSAGDLLYVTTTSEYLLIQSVDSSTQMTATTNAANSTLAGAYVMIPSWPVASQIAFTEMNGFLWLCGQGDIPVKWNGSFSPHVTAFPQASYALVYKNYTFALNTSTNPSRVAWCSLKDPTTWPASNFVDVRPDDGFPIVGVFNDGQSIVILKTNTVWRLTGDVFDPSNPTYTLVQVYTPSDFRINSAKSVQLVNGRFIMLGQKGFYAYDGSTVQFIQESYNIKSEISQMLNFNLYTAPAAAAEPSSIMVDGNYWLSVESSKFSHTTGYKNCVYVIDKSFKFWEWNQNVNAEISDFTYYKGTLYGVNADTGATAGLQTLNTASSDTGSNAINGTWTSKILEYDNQNQFLQATVYFKKQSAGNLTFGYQVDEGGYTNVTIDMTGPVTGGNRGKSQIITIGQVGSTLQFQLSNNVAAQTFEVYGIEFTRRPLSV